VLQRPVTQAKGTDPGELLGHPPGTVAPIPPHWYGALGAHDARPPAQRPPPEAQLPPSGTFGDALAAGAITVCMTGTLHATPPTMPAFFRNSRREAAGGEAGTGAAGVLEAVVFVSALSTFAARLAQRSSHSAMRYPRE
jgi:hypothetical protein